MSYFNNNRISTMTNINILEMVKFLELFPDGASVWIFISSVDDRLVCALYVT